jgi:ABC-type transport system substrate-binding protein
VRFRAIVLMLALAGCAGRERCPRCETVVVAAVGEPGSVLPPLVQETVGRDILVPATSGSRRKLAEELQQMWKAIEARVTVTALDFPVFQEQLAAGRFEAYIGAWLDKPSTGALTDQWSRSGWEATNYGRYHSPRS